MYTLFSLTINEQQDTSLNKKSNRWKSYEATCIQVELKKIVKVSGFRFLIMTDQMSVLKRQYLKLLAAAANGNFQLENANFW